MIAYQSLKYFLLETCLNTFLDKLQLNLRINLPPIILPERGSFYKEIHGPDGHHFANMVCKEILKLKNVSFLHKDEDSNENVYLFAKEGNSQYDNLVFIEMIIKESDLSNWVLIS